MRRLRLTLAIALVSSSFAVQAVDVRALDNSGRVLTVGTFALVPTDGGSLVRVESATVLSWEIHDQDLLVAHGVVPGTEGSEVDLQPALSRDPVSGDCWMAWSREPALGSPRQIAWVRIGSSGPDAQSLTTLAVGSGDQVEPSVLHDEAGNAFIAWVDESAGRHVMLLGLSPAGSNLGLSDISAGRSLANSAPRMGITATGEIFLAYVGADSSTGEPSLFVAARSALPGGVTHVPNPLIELGVQATLPAPTLTIEALEHSFAPNLRLTVLGGTAIAWWTETTADNRLLFRYAAEPVGGWAASTIQTIDLSTGTLGSVSDALEMLEARLRRVISPAPPTVMPGPGRGWTRPSLVDRR